MLHAKWFSGGFLRLERARLFWRFIVGERFRKPALLWNERLLLWVAIETASLFLAEVYCVHVGVLFCFSSYGPFLDGVH